MRHLLSALSLLLMGGAAQAFCGFYAGKADAKLFNEASQVVLARDGQRTVLTMVNDYAGPLSEFALVVPTPQVIRQGQVKVLDKAVVEHLDAYSAPRLAEYRDNDPCQLSLRWSDRYRIPQPPMYRMPAPVSAPTAQALGITVDAQFTLEEYDIVSLSATQSDGLEQWLRENGYRIPAGASAALKPYVAQGMKFFVAKVNLREQLKTGYQSLRPLQFAFESEKFMLPMRLGMLNAAPDQPQDLIIYVLGREGRVESSNYRTVKLPTDVNLPPFVKPRFADFYKAMFAEQARKEDHRVVFTEYAWDMAWCDPCAANPLSREELLKLGAQWVSGAALGGGGAQPVVLSRLHLRYTPQSFPEDLMLTQTRDRQNWQARYVIQQPYAGTVAECSERVGREDCERHCTARLEELDRTQYGLLDGVRERLTVKAERAELRKECVSDCQRYKLTAIVLAARYYEQTVPDRVAREKLTLAQLTGWSLADIDAWPEAAPYRVLSKPPQGTWWERLWGR